MAGLVAPAVTGVLVDQTGQFTVAFAIAAAANVVGFIGWVLILPKVAPLRWADSAA
jgi:dipeptide/tripeptide permease